MSDYVALLDGESDYPRQQQCLDVMLSLYEFVSAVSEKLPKVWKQQIVNEAVDQTSVERLCKATAERCLSMSTGDTVGPQPAIATNILALAHHFHQLDPSIDTAPLYRIVDRAFQAGLTDRDMHSAQQRIQDWLECKQKKGRS